MHKLLVTILLLIVRQLTCFNTERYCQPFVVMVLVGTSLICFTVALTFKFCFKPIILLLDTIYNLDKISQSTAEIKLHWFWKTDGRYFGIQFPVSVFALFSSSACHSALAYQISSK